MAMLMSLGEMQISDSEHDIVKSEHTFTEWVSLVLLLADVKNQSKLQTTSYKTIQVLSDREEFDPKKVTLQDKLWGIGEELKCTVHFVIHVGIDAWQMIAEEDEIRAIYINSSFTIMSSKT